MSNAYRVSEPGTLRPHGCRILIKPDPPAEKENALWVPETARDRDRKEKKYGTGVVVSMGPGMPIDRVKRSCDRWPMPDGKREDVLPDIHGKRVLYFVGAATRISIDDVEYDVVRDESVDAVVEA